MSHGHSYWSGTLVQTGPGTFEVRFPTKRAAVKDRPGVRDQTGKQAKRRAAAKADAELDLRQKWYVSADRKQIVNGLGAVISNEVCIVKQAVVSGHKKVYLRFLYEGTVWVGYTLSVEPNRIKAKRSKSIDLYPKKKARTKKLCPGCSGVTKTETYCAACRHRLGKVPCGNPSCKNMVNSTNNKTGLCSVCVKQVNPYGSFVPPPPRQFRKGNSSHDSKRAS